MLYGTHGLLIKSELPLPSLIESSLPPDSCAVEVTLGPVPERLDGPTTSSPILEADATRILLRLPRIGRFLIEDGKRISVQPEAGVADQTLDVWITGRCLSAILYQRGAFPIHASSCVIEDRAYAFSGPSQSGKSTLLAGLIKRGAANLTDDLILPSIDENGVVWVAPGRPTVRLWKDALERDKPTEVATAPRVLPELDKFVVNRSASFHDAPARLQALFVLAPVYSNELRIDALPPHLALAALVENVSCPDLLDATGARGAHLPFAAALVQRAPVLQIMRPRTINRLDDLLRLVHSWASNKGSQPLSD